MVLSIHSSATFQGDGAWPSVWPPVKLPPPSPLSAAATALWSPKPSTPDSSSLVLDPNGPLYSTQLPQGGQSAPPNSQIDFLDQRMAIMSFDASQAPSDNADNVAA